MHITCDPAIPLWESILYIYSHADEIMDVQDYLS